MPELPEVETIVRELNRAIAGKNLSRFSVFDKKRLAEPRLKLPQKITSVSRHGKYIVCETSGELRCLIHLRMTGELLLKKQQTQSLRTINHEPSSRKQKHERARFHLNDGSILHFIDVRRFGTIEWRKNGEPLPVLGPNPLSRYFNSSKFVEIIRGHSRVIKSLLLDQKIVAGIGNIYADEALWTAKIYPKRESGSLSSKEIGKLTAAIKKVLRTGIKSGGFTLRDYRRIDGSSGYYQKSRKVYDREGLPCLRCKTKIRRMKVGGRSSYFCPKCQK